jgi:hypothetical protein
VGVLIAICAALVGSSTLSQHTPVATAVAWVAFVGPLAAGLILACMPRTRRFGVGLSLGVFVTLIVCGGPLTCVALIAKLHSSAAFGWQDELICRPLEGLLRHSSAAHQGARLPWASTS